MRKIITILLIAGFFASAASASLGELNVKAGVNLAGKAKGLNLPGTTINKGESFDINTGAVLGAEYLIPVIDLVRLGGGVQYLLPRRFKDLKRIPDDFIYSWIPIYFTAQVNPFITLLSQNEHLKGIFVKRNIGYNFFNGDASTVVITGGEFKTKYSGGVYYSIGVGYEFPFSLILELAYSVHKSKVSLESKAGYSKQDSDISYDNVGKNIGYKFKI